MKRAGQIGDPSLALRGEGPIPHASLVSVRTAATLAYTAWWVFPFGIVGLNPKLGVIQLAMVGLVIGVARLAFGYGRLGLWGPLVWGTFALTALQSVLDGWPWGGAAPALVAVLFGVRCAWAVGYAMLLGSLVRGLVRDPATDSGDRALTRAMAWIAAPSAALGVLLYFLLWNLGWKPWREWVLLSVFVYILVPGAIVFVTRARARSRSRWLARVRNGVDPEWRVAPASSVAPAALPEIDLACASRLGRDLLFRVATSTDPYRETESLEPVAIVRRG